MKLHELFADALTDFEELRHLEGIEINMREWLKRNEDNTCEMCVAGCYLYKQLNIRVDLPRSEYHQWARALPDDFGLRANVIDELRIGDIENAVHEWYGDKSFEYDEIVITDYDDDPDQCVADMYYVLSELQRLDK